MRRSWTTPPSRDVEHEDDEKREPDYDRDEESEREERERIREYNLRTTGRGIGDLALYGSTTALFDARARMGDALSHVAALRRLLTTAELSCGPMKKHYLVVVDNLRKARAALAKIDRVDFDSAEQGLVVRDARALTATYNTTLDEMLVIQRKLEASCSRGRQPVYRR